MIDTSWGNPELANKGPFSVKFKGQVYDDAHYDSFGKNILFGENDFEYVSDPSYGAPYVNMRGWKPAGNGWSRTCKKSTAKVTIL